MEFVVAYAATLIAFLLIDLIWIATVARTLYRNEVAELLRERPRGGAAGLFYLAYAGGLVVFAIVPGTTGGTLTTVALGATFGALAYGTFTVTNYALLRHWTLRLVVSDIAWGAVLSAVSSVAGLLAWRTLV